MSDLLGRLVQKALGAAPADRESELVGRALREAGDEQVLGLIERAGAEIDADAVRPHRLHRAGRDRPGGWRRLFTVLDLIVEVTSPSWTRQPVRAEGCACATCAADHAHVEGWAEGAASWFA